DLGVVKEWLEECESSHSRCWAQSEHVRNHLSLEGLTFRVINCAEKKIFPLPRNTQYLTLSYRWGAASADEDDVPDGQLPTRFPKAIHDAMKATLGLGFKYLWIDRYCIYQSDPRDKKLQISRMGAIYSSSFATIVAAAGEDPTFGLPGISPRPSSRVLKKEKSTWVITPMSRTAVRESTWNTRGWTYQEAVLSLRLICFLPQQIYFECRQCCLIESVSFLDSTKGIIAPHIEPLFSMYTTKVSELEQGHGGLYGHIEKYTYRELTMPNDILNGISGVFEDICSQESGFHFLSGVPTISKSSFTVNSQSTLKTPAQHFASCLCWIKIGPAQRREGFPSWSWAGW
ncbi:heterokaryon incompatibility protein-domain-containing protein, partial [Cadophora sp. MPI-SDFR-AT-0126]